jgi:hypothetical protein
MDTLSKFRVWYVYGPCRSLVVGLAPLVFVLLVASPAPDI